MVGGNYQIKLVDLGGAVKFGEMPFGDPYYSPPQYGPADNKTDIWPFGSTVLEIYRFFSLFLTGYASKVSIIHRRNELRASGILVEKAKRDPKIHFILESIVEEILGIDKVEAVRIKNVKTNAQTDVSCQGVFIFVGIKPNTDFLKNLLDSDDFGFIITDQEMRASKAGVFACGDCRKKSLYQVVTACGEGAAAADSAYKYIINKR